MKLKVLCIEVLYKCSPSLCELHGKLINDSLLHLTLVIFRQPGNAESCQGELGAFELYCVLLRSISNTGQPRSVDEVLEIGLPLSEIQFNIFHALQPPKYPWN